MNKNKNRNSSILWIFLIIIVIALLTIIVFSYPNWINNKFNYNLYHMSPNEFGDSYGALNTLFSALAFGILIITVFMQKQELRYQREELQDNRKEYEYNRLTNVVYKQLERIEEHIKNFSIHDDIRDTKSKKIC